MPTWQIHNKWAEKASISEEISNYVNLLIDLPEKHGEFLDFCASDPDARIYSRGRQIHMNIGQWVKHDSARAREYIRNIQLKFLHRKGDDYIKAFYLHHILDYLRWWVTEESFESIPSIQDILSEKRVAKKIGSPQDQYLQSMKSFVISHSEEILRDCGR